MCSVDTKSGGIIRPGSKHNITGNREVIETI